MGIHSLSELCLWLSSSQKISNIFITLALHLLQMILEPALLLHRQIVTDKLASKWHSLVTWNSTKLLLLIQLSLGSLWLFSLYFLPNLRIWSTNERTPSICTWKSQIYFEHFTKIHSISTRINLTPLRKGGWQRKDVKTLYNKLFLCSLKWKQLRASQAG